MPKRRRDFFNGQAKLPAWLVHGQTKLPAWFRVALSIATLSALFAIVLVHSFPLATAIQNRIEDLQVAKLTPPAPQHPDIVIVTITEETLSAFPYRKPVDRAFLADLLTTLAAKGARLVAVDVLFDQPTEPAKDERLREIIRDYPIPLAISYATTREGLNETQQAYLDHFVPFDNRAMANLLTDPHDDVARWLFPGREFPELGYIPGFPYAVVGQLGLAGQVEPHEPSRPYRWRHGPKSWTDTFTTYPSHTVKFLPAAWLQDKIVLIGADLHIEDRHRTPFSVHAGADEPENTPGIVIHAHGIATLLGEAGEARLPSVIQFLLVLLVALLGAWLGRPTVATWLQVVGLVFVLAVIWGGGFSLYKWQGLFFPLIESTQALLFSLIIAIAYSGRSEREQKRQVKQAFSRYLSKELVEQLTRDPSRLTRQAERRELTFLFTDVEGFTTVCEGTDPAILGPLLNAYLDGVCSAVIRNGGMIVDLIGDSVFAMFGAPIDHPDHAVRALTTAREVHRFAADFQQTKEALNCHFGRTRIGVHSGAAQVGNFGSEERFKYVPLGDAVNTASRIEGLNKHFLTTVCVSDAAIQQFERQRVHSSMDRGADLIYRPIGYVVMKGKSQAMLIHELMDPDAPMVVHLTAYREAFAALAQGDLATAQAGLADLQAKQPDDYILRMHLDRLNEGRTDAVIVMDKK